MLMDHIFPALFLIIMSFSVLGSSYRQALPNRHFKISYRCCLARRARLFSNIPGKDATRNKDKSTTTLSPITSRNNDYSQWLVQVESNSSFFDCYYYNCFYFSLLL